ncbi:D-Ala-D-Ala carboxypeptidase family metallohydrolase [Aquabacter sp. CN5-332]|uniref:D-Ala-D-Ala carboxypeptidase family metallohydrolase n=1 Tax=Aquabacter sp. CN5-332 TaxID=3156608 RepID=UPI0032B4CDB5
MALILRFVLLVLVSLTALAPAHAKARKAPARSQSGQTSTDCVPDTLKAVLSDVSAKFGAVEVISTNRPGAVIAGTRKASLHRACRAVDFKVATGTRRAVIAYLRADPRVQGLGIYRSGHIHIDNGPYRVTWNK